VTGRQRSGEIEEAHMRHRLLHLVAAGLGVASGSAPDVTIQVFQFRPGQAAVAAGTKVTWTNQDDITHTITSGTPEKQDGRFDAQLAGKGATATVEFKEPGVYPYFCNRHPSMRGEIRVN
jgi:plastocyanin